MTTPHTGAPIGTPPPYDEEAGMAYVYRLLELEQAGERNQVTIGPYSLFVMIGAMQLVIRKPDIGGTVRDTLIGLIGQWRAPFDGTFGAQMIDLGYDPAFDGDGKPNSYGSFEEWLARKYPDPVGRQCIEAGEADLHEAFYAGRASVTKKRVN